MSLEHRSKIRLNRFTDNPFPFKGLSLLSKCSFVGSGIDGYIEKIRKEVIIGDEMRLLPAGTPFLEIHLSLESKNIANGEFTEVGEHLLKGARDLIALSTRLSMDPRFKEINIIAGTTNPRLARLATRKLGFHYGHTESLDPLVYRRLNKTGQSIYITKDELSAQIPQLRDLSAEIASGLTARKNRKVRNS